MNLFLRLFLAFLMVLLISGAALPGRHGVTADETKELHRAEIAFSVIFIASLAVLIITTVKKRRNGKD